MTLPLLEREPVQLIAGDSASWAKSLDGCTSAQGWTLSYRLFGPLGSAATTLDVTIAATPDGSGWVVALLPSVTADVVRDGSYRLVGRAANATTGEATTVYNATLRLLANPLDAQASGLQTHAERALAMIEAAIEKRLPADMEHYQIDGKVIGKIAMRDLMRLRAKYRLEVWRARNPGVSMPQRLVRFGA